MLLECHNCGAPLDAKDGASSARCPYCGQKSEVAKFRTTALQTPEGWKPPPQWTPPSTSSVPIQPLEYRPVPVGRIVARWLGISGLMTAALGGFIAWRVLASVGDMAGNAALSAFTQSGDAKKLLGDALAVANKLQNGAIQVASTAGDTLPVLCKGNDSITISGKTLVLPGSIPVVVSGNCTLHLIACTVSGATAVVAKGNGTVVIVGGTYSGTGPAVLLSDNATLEVSASAHLTGESTVTVTNNAQASIHDSTVIGAHVAVQSSGNSSVDTSGSVVQGKVLGRVRR